MSYILSGVTGNMDCNLIVPDQVFVYNYDQTSGDNFQVYYTQEAASFVVPQTNSVYTGLIGSPASGLTNQQNWTTYGIAIAGAMAPSNAATMTGIGGLVVTGIAPDVIIAPSASTPSGSSATAGKGTTANMAPLAVGLLAQPQNSGLSSNIDPSTSVTAPATLATTRSVVKVGTTRSATGGLVAGPLALNVPSAGTAVQTAARSPGLPPLTAKVSQD